MSLRFIENNNGGSAHKSKPVNPKMFLIMQTPYYTRRTPWPGFY